MLFEPFKNMSFGGIGSDKSHCQALPSSPKSFHPRLVPLSGKILS